MTLVNTIAMLLLLWVPDEVLILKNGKQIRCDTYERSEDKVKLVRDGQTFTLFNHRIDWDKTALYKEQNQAARSKPDPNPNPKPKRKSSNGSIGEMAEFYAERNKDKKAVVITNDNLGGGKARSTTVTHRFRRIGNSIIVQARLNGSGPFDFVLDTGAQMTMISSTTASSLGLKGTGGVPISGVGGTRMASTAELSSVSIDGARVDNMPVIINDAEALARMNVVGLLGQDFLNHFVVSVDTVRSEVTFKPQGSAFHKPNEAMVETSFRSILPRIQSMIDGVESLTVAYVQNGSFQAGGKQRLQEYTVVLPEIRTRATELGQVLDNRVSAAPSGEARKIHEKNARCFPLIERILMGLDRHIHMLRGIYQTETVEKRNQAMDSWNKIVEDLIEVKRCDSN